MKQIDSVLIAGAGAIGLLIADTLYRYNPGGVRILASGERQKRYRGTGLWVNGERLDFSFADGETPEGNRTDLIIVACKHHHLEQVIADTRPFVGEETIILSLLNGITSEETIGAVYGRERLPLAMIIGTDSQNTGNGTSFTRRGVVNFGDAGGRETARDRLIADYFTRAGLPFEYHPNDMKRAFWYKYMINVGANQSSALLRLPYACFKRNHPRGIDEARRLLESAMREVIAIANRLGIDLGDRDIENWYSTLAALNDSGYTSMCQDVLAGRKTEVELFGLTIGEMGLKYGIPTPVNSTLALALRAIEQAYGIVQPGS
ncbi:MAG: ketopantoate reductase family protein [Spirochaetaceae bacterium]|jgi:2-dehydropantoate 2-reductase|nr:ketopantoate reductase family protein [Spirochaetaceae bacterium]